MKYFFLVLSLMAIISPLSHASEVKFRTNSQKDNTTYYSAQEGEAPRSFHLDQSSTNEQEGQLTPQETAPSAPLLAEAPPALQEPQQLENEEELEPGQPLTQDQITPSQSSKYQRCKTCCSTTCSTTKSCCSACCKNVAIPCCTYTCICCGKLINLVTDEHGDLHPLVGCLVLLCSSILASECQKHQPGSF